MCDFWRITAKASFIGFCYTDHKTPHPQHSVMLELDPRSWLYWHFWITSNVNNFQTFANEINEVWLCQGQTELKMISLITISPFFSILSNNTKMPMMPALYISKRKSNG